jgi:hypothetical protein
LVVILTLEREGVKNWGNTADADCPGKEIEMSQWTLLTILLVVVVVVLVVVLV